MQLKLKSQFKPAGDQIKAIKQLVSGVKEKMPQQTLMGVTGSGKTFSMSKVIEQLQKPTLVISHNKTLAAQLCNEFRHFFPENSVHYFVSYYDYYQPEAYIKSSDTYIRKEAMINEEIDKLRHAATTALLTREDVIVVASVSCIYDLGLPQTYSKNIFSIKKGEKIDRKDIISSLVKMQLTRTPSVLSRGKFRVRGDNIQIFPVNEEVIYDIQISQGVVEKIFVADPIEGFGPNTRELDTAIISPVRHFLSEKETIDQPLKKIEKELIERIKYFEKNNMPLEAERIEQITRNDIAMIREIGYCHGIENYSRHLSGRKEGESPSSLLDYFNDDFLTIIDESHITIPQIRSMHSGNYSRKKNLIDNGFRLPSAIDNRPLTFNEFEKKLGQTVHLSATPGPYEYEKSNKIVEQIIRPTGLVDPKVIISSCIGQVEDLLKRINHKVSKKQRTLVTTLTKKMAEDLTEYMLDKGIKVSYIHSDVKSLDRIKILSSLRRGDVDVVVGVNLLREGLDLPEVSLVAILDADKEGFLRSETSLIQTIGRAARNVDGEVVFYADKITGSIKRAISETDRRRKIQIAYNKKYNIIPKTIVKEITDIIPAKETLEIETKPLREKDREELIKEKEKEMRDAAKNLNFELAAILRDQITALQNERKNNNKRGKRT